MSTEMEAIHSSVQFSSVQFSSGQDGLCMLGKNPLRSVPSFKGFLNIAFKRNPIFV